MKTNKTYSPAPSGRISITNKRIRRCYSNLPGKKKKSLTRCMIMHYLHCFLQHLSQMHFCHLMHYLHDASYSDWNSREASRLFIDRKNYAFWFSGWQHWQNLSVFMDHTTIEFADLRFNLKCISTALKRNPTCAYCCVCSQSPILVSIVIVDGCVQTAYSGKNREGRGRMQLEFDFQTNYISAWISTNTLNHLLKHTTWSFLRSWWAETVQRRDVASQPETTKNFQTDGTLLAAELRGMMCFFTYSHFMAQSCNCYL